VSDASAGASAEREPPVVLVPVAVLEGQTVGEPLAEFLSDAEVVVLGYHVVPEQTPTEQASMQFEERARAAVEDIAATFREAAAAVDTRVAFTHERDQTVERVAAEVGATAVLLPNPAGDIENVLVALRGAIDAERLANLVATLLGDGQVTLWGLGSETFDAEAAIEEARAMLTDRGVPAARITTKTTASETPVYDIVEQSAAADAIVMGAGGPSLFSALFGDDAERVAEGAVAPVLVVGRRSDGEGK
jgi:nucleotide-binding universal stress UspA family protein